MSTSPPFDTVFEIISRQAAAAPHNIALRDHVERTITYHELLDCVGRFALALRLMGFHRKSRIGLVLPNGVDLAAAMLGISSASTCVPFNPAFREDEYRAYFGETRVDCLVTMKNFETKARSVAREKCIPIIDVSDEGRMSLTAENRNILESEDMLRRTTNGLPPSEYAAPDDIALILLTSGSTGRSKKVPLMHSNVCASVADICRTLELSSADTCLCMWEQFHIGGLVDLLLAPIASGGSVVCAGRFDAALFYGLLRSSQRVTWFQGVPTTLYELFAYAKRNNIEPSGTSLRFIRSVASSLSPRLMQQIESLFGVPVLQTFGMTEAGPLITTNRLPPVKRVAGSVGQSCGPEIRIVSSDDEELSRGSIGEIAIRGANVISEYEDAPDANERAFRGGWFHTGDTGYLDDENFLYLTGRIKEMINRGGEKITPQEVDDVLLTHPSIAQAASFSIKHRTLGEDIAVAIVPRENHTISETDVRDYAAARLAYFKIPQKIFFLSTMPRDPIGKINRLSLSTFAESQLQARTDGLESRNRDRTELESFLIRLWKVELDLDDVDPDTDFVSLGGDSLSSVRLLSAAETMLQVQIPEEDIAKCATVSGMAKVLVDLGCPPHGFLHRVDGRRISISEIDARAVLQQDLPSGHDLIDPVQAVRADFQKAQTPNELSAARERMLTICLPAEAREIVSHYLASQKQIFGFRSLLRVGRLIKIMQSVRFTLKEIDSARLAAWKRYVICPGVILFACGEASHRKTLIVGFTTSAHRLMMPSYRALLNMDADESDLLLLLDSNRQHYEYGLPGLCDDPGSLAEYLDQFRRDRGYRNTVSLGMSASGLAAIYVALRNKWNAAFTVAVDRKPQHPIICKAIAELLVSKEISRTKVVNVYSGKNRGDCAAADELKLWLPCAEMRPDRRFDNHNLLHDLYLGGELSSFFRMLVSLG
jgi:acyl-CoA synthetase (AMP-forming)/AMP-acid ligase II/acyl carrier protein